MGKTPDRPAENDTATVRAPILTNTSDEKADVAALATFLKQLSANPIQVAANEAERIAPYLETLAAQSRADFSADGPRETKQVRHALDEDGLGALFNAVTRRTQNVILSDIIISPISLAARTARSRRVKMFGKTGRYGHNRFFFGFLQAYQAGYESSVSVPIFSFENGLLDALRHLAPENLLREFQTIMGAGNHDMLHHYTNSVLNSRIARTEGTGKKLKRWTDSYFSAAEEENRDSDIHGYESWLVLNHARIRRAMEQGPEGDALRQSCARFFDELERIGRGVARLEDADKAHEVVDYFGSMLCFALMRYVPMNHPLMQEAIRRLEQADPQADSILTRADTLHQHAKESSFTVETVLNYARTGADFTVARDYASLKALEIIGIAPTIAHLMSPGQPGSELAFMQQRVGYVNGEMLKACISDTLTPHKVKRWKNKLQNT